MLVSCYANLIYFLLCVRLTASFDWASLKLVRNHVPYVFAHQKSLRSACLDDPACPYKEEIETSPNACWGFEPGCTDSDRFASHHPTVECRDERSKQKYFHEADFGYLRNRLEELKTRRICKPFKNSKHKASLSCTSDATMCAARGMYVDMRESHARTATQRGKLLLQRGEIGARCKLDDELLRANTRHRNSLTSWGEQLAPFTQLEFDPFANTSRHCDVIVDKPTVFVQLDFGGNLYHHMCDFFNLYLTQLSNHSWFGTDVQVVRWDVSHRYGDLFTSAWKAFTDHDHVSWEAYHGKRVCVRRAIFAFLPRMPFGLFYSTPLQENCRGSNLFRAFSQHFLHRMGVVDDRNLPVTSSPSSADVIRVTFLDRGQRPNYKVYRRILNQDDLVRVAGEIPDFQVQVVEFSPDKIGFEDQLRITRSTDIFIGMHGAGLAHFLFLPDWAVAFELYNCGDVRCYRDLARLRGLRYMTWRDDSSVTTFARGEHPSSGHNSKFWNYSFDPGEFRRLLLEARDLLLLDSERFARLRSRDEL